MSQHLQLQLICKTLDTLGHAPVAELLQQRLSAEGQRDDSPYSNPLQELISCGAYPTIVSILRGSKDDFHFSDALKDSISSLPAEDRALASYLVLRTALLEKVLLISLGSATPSAEQDAFRFLQDTVSPALGGVDLTVINPVLAGNLSSEKELLCLLPLIMHPPARDNLDATMFSSRVLLCNQPAPSHLPHDDSTYFVRLRNSLSWLLREYTKVPKSISASALALSLIDIPDNCLAEVMYNASRFVLSKNIYYLPARDNLASELDLSVALSNAAPASRDDLPIHLLHTLSTHTDEVWYTRFSPSGNFLATGSLDGTCIIYDVTDNFKVIALLDANTEDENDVFVESSHKPPLDKKKGIIYFSWEPHERYIVTCCLDTVIRVWNIENVVLRKRVTRLMNGTEGAKLVSCFTLGERMRTWPCEFMNYPIDLTPHFIVGSPDRVLKVFSINGLPVLDFYSDADEWLTILGEDGTSPTTSATVQTASRADDQSTDAGESGNTGTGSASQFNRINDFAVTPNRKVLVTANNDKQVLFYKIPDMFDPATTTSKIAQVKLNGRLTSCNVSANGKHLLLNIAPDELQVWDISPLDSFDPPFLKQKLFGQSQANFMVRSCFGYLNTYDMTEELVLSGSDDGYIYIWRLSDGKLITRVQGHTALCNSVDWNRFFVHKQGRDYGKYWCSVGDDRLVKIWGPRAS